MSRFNNKFVPTKKVQYNIPNHTNERPLYLHMFYPDSHPFSSSNQTLPTIIFFFGGGFRTGTPDQFYPYCEELKKVGMIAIAADYRIKDVDGTSPKECFQDTISAIQYIKDHALELHVDVMKIIASGGSAGGHTSLCAALNKKLNVAGYVGFNPVSDASSIVERLARFNNNLSKIFNDISRDPMKMISSSTPKDVISNYNISIPMLLMHGEKDETVPIESNINFIEKLHNDFGLDETTIKLISYPNQTHGFFNYDRNIDMFNSTLFSTIDFLRQHNFIRKNNTNSYSNDKHSNDNTFQYYCLSEDQLKFYDENGYIVLHNIFTKDEIEPVKHLIDLWTLDVVEEIAENYPNDISPQLKETLINKGIEKRMAIVDENIPGIAMYLQGLFMRDRNRVMKKKQFRTLRSNNKILDVLEQLLKSNKISAHPNFTIRVRTPTPSGLNSEFSDRGQVPFHQDAGYLLDDAKDTTVIGVWLPLQEVNPLLNNGCLQFIAGSHKKRKILQHKQGNQYLLVEPDDINKEFGHLEKTELITVPYGSCVLFNNFTAHRSLENTSNTVRWSFDMRYQETNKPHGMGKNGGLVPLRPYQNIGWEEGPKGPTSGVLGGYGRKASAAALEANRDVEMKKVRNKFPRVKSSKPGDSKRFMLEGRSL